MMGQETVLVTGAGGFIGSNLVDDQLGKGRRVIAFDIDVSRLSHLADHPACVLVEGDVRNSALLAEHVAGADIIFHLASAHLEVSKSDAYFWETNVNAVRNLLKLAVDHGVSRFVHCSSVGVYGPLRDLPADERTPCRPEILYEETKLKGEAVVRDFVESHGLSAVILRPAWVYGPRCPRTLKLFRTLKRRRFLMVGRGDNMRHPIYITDMLQAFELAATRPDIEGQTFVVASDKPVKLQELVDTIIGVQKLDYRPARIPLPVMTPMCWAVERTFQLIGKEPPFSTRSLKFFTESSAFDISKAKDTLRFKPQVPLLNGLSRTHEHFVRSGLL